MRWTDHNMSWALPIILKPSRRCCNNREALVGHQGGSIEWWRGVAQVVLQVTSVLGILRLMCQITSCLGWAHVLAGRGVDSECQRVDSSCRMHMRNRLHSESVVVCVSAKLSHKVGQDITLFINGHLPCVSRSQAPHQQTMELSHESCSDRQ